MNMNKSYKSHSQNSSTIAIGVFMALIMAVGLFFAFTPSRHDTCTVTGKGYSMAVDKEQQHNIIHTSCGDFAFHQSGMGATGPSRIEVGKRYDFGYHGWHLLWSKPTVLTWTEVSK